MKRKFTDQYQLRMPAGLRKRIKLASDSTDKSMNLLIVETLEHAFPDEREQLRAALRVIEAQIEKAPAEDRESLMRLKNDLVVKLYFEPLDGEEEAEE